MTHRVDDDEFETIFTAKITTRSGKVIYAWQRGLKAFAIRVRRKPLEV